MFTQAGFNARGRWTGIKALTLPARGEPGKSYRPVCCELYRFESGDCAWIAQRRFIAWPNQVGFVHVDGMQTWRIRGFPSGPRPICNLNTREERRAL